MSIKTSVNTQWVQINQRRAKVDATPRCRSTTLMRRDDVAPTPT